MKTVLFYGPKEIRLEDRPIPKAGPGEVIIKNKVALTCGTDVKMYLRGYPLWDPPYSFGHEASGVIMEIGEGVTRFDVGDRVVAHNSVPCNKCYFCKNSQQSLCENITFNLGAFSEYQRIPKEIVKQNMFSIPEQLSFKDAALLEPFSCAVYGTEEIGISLGDTVVVNGAGPIGLMFIRLAYFKGAKVIATDLSDKRLMVAEKLGAWKTINVKDLKEPIKVIKSYTENERGADVVIEAVGIEKVWEQAIQMARKGGKILLFGGTKSGTSINVNAKLLHYSQLTIKGVFHTTPKHVGAAFELIKQGIITSKEFVYNEYNLENLEKAILEHKKGQVIKNCIVFD